MYIYIGNQHEDKDISDMLQAKPMPPDLLQLFPPYISEDYLVIAAYLNVDCRKMTAPNANNKTKLTTILQLWLDSDDDIIRPAKWYIIIEMFEKSIITDKKIADDIRTFLRRPDVQQRYIIHQT